MKLQRRKALRNVTEDLFAWAEERDRRQRWPLTPAARRFKERFGLSEPVAALVAERAGYSGFEP